MISASVPQRPTRSIFTPSYLGIGATWQFSREKLVASISSMLKIPPGFHRGIYDEAVTLLLQSRVDLWQIGGSHAQRDVVDWTLAEAAVRAGQRDVALALAHERLAARPRSAPNRRFLRHAEAIAD